jgi:FAD binding domain/Berberine and berberine like
VPDLAAFAGSLDGELFSPGSSGYEAIRRPVNAAYREVRPRLVVLCRSVSDVAGAIAYAAAAGERLVPRGGGHCFAGRSSTDGVVVDTSGLDAISVTADAVATIGAGARLGRVYAALHAHRRTLPAGCGPSVGIAGLTLGGGIGLLGRKHGLTCDRLVGAQVVLADGSVVDCDDDHEPDLFWGLRGAGGGQLGVVTALRFDTVLEPLTTRIEAHWSNMGLEELASAWQAWAPEAPDELTVNLTLECRPGAPARAILFGASTLDEGPTRELLRAFTEHAGVASTMELRTGLPYHRLKSTFDDAGDPPDQRMRSEFFSRSMADCTLASLLSQLGDSAGTGRRQLTFTAMGGAYNRVAQDATAFAHRGERFLLEHLAEAADPWVDDSWATAHADGSGHVYPNFPDPALDDWVMAYHAGNYPRLAAIKNAYDPHRFFDFPQAI